MKAKFTSLKDTLPFFVLGLAAYIIVDYCKTKTDRIYRMAAGESMFEKTHLKKKRK